MGWYVIVFNTAETSADISDSLKLRYSITTKLEKSFLITKIEIRFFKGLINLSRIVRDEKMLIFLRVRGEAREWRQGGLWAAVEV